VKSNEFNQTVEKLSNDNVIEGFPASILMNKLKILEAAIETIEFFVFGEVS